MTLVRPNVAARFAVPYQFIRNGDPVSASDWNRIAMDINYAAACGRTIVPSFKPDTELDLSDGDYTWTFSIWLEPSWQAIQRLAFTTYRFHNATGGIIRANGLGAVDVLSAKANNLQLVTVGAQSTTGTAVDLTIDLTAQQENGFCSVDGIQIVEIPRARLVDDANERGIDASVFTSGQPIAWSLGAEDIRDATEDDAQIGRRVLLHYAEPYKTSRQPSPATESGAGGEAVTSATFVTVRGGSGSPVLARKLRTTDTTRVVKARAFARASSSTTTGEVRFVSSANGASSTITLDGSVTTDFAWSSAVDLTVDCEDLATVQGLQGAAWDEVSVEARRTAGVGNIHVCGWVVYEAGP